MIKPTLFTLALFAAVTAGPVIASADPPATPPSTASRPEPSHAIYRFDIAVRRPEDAANAHLPTYTITLEENHSGAVSIGTNIPLLSASAPPGTVAPRQDVGLMLHLGFVMQGNTIVVTGNAEMSTAESASSGPVSIHRIRAEGVVPLTPGRPGLFTSITDISSHRAYEITITATRLL